MANKLNIVFQMDYPDKINPPTDTTLLLMNSLLSQGENVLFYNPTDLKIIKGEIIVDINIYNGNLNNAQKILNYNFYETNVLFVRQDPPFDISYITRLYFLNILKSQNNNILFLNDPQTILSFPEKLSFFTSSTLQKYLPKTIISNNFSEIEDFRNNTGNIVIKPLYGYAGDGVFVIKDGDKNLLTIYESFKKMYPNLQMIVQEYLPDAQKADKRVIIINHEIKGFFARVQNNSRGVSSLRSGATTEVCKLSNNEMNLINELCSFTKINNIFFAGIDIIGEKLTEINITCPTGIPAANRLLEKRIDLEIIDIIRNLIQK